MEVFDNLKICSTVHCSVQFLAPIAAQGVAMFVRLSLRQKVFQFVCMKAYLKVPKGLGSQFFSP